MSELAENVALCFKQHAEQRAEIERLRTIILRSGLWKHAPCVLCGYNGQGYYQSETHECARLDAALAPAREA